MKHIGLKSMFENYHRLPRTDTVNKFNNTSTNECLNSTVKLQDLKSSPFLLNFVL